MIILTIILALACDDIDTESADSECSKPEVGCFNPSWEIEGQQLKLSFIEAEPRIPERGVNSWLISISSHSGEPLNACELELTPYMPEHGHGSPLKPIVNEQGEGIYLIEQIAFSMPGLWEMSFEVSCADLELESLVYPFWLDA